MRSITLLAALVLLGCTNNVTNVYQVTPDAGAQAAVGGSGGRAGTDAGTDASREAEAGPCKDGERIACKDDTSSGVIDGCYQTCVGGQLMPCVCGGGGPAPAPDGGGSGGAAGAGGTGGSSAVDAGVSDAKADAVPCTWDPGLQKTVCGQWVADCLSPDSVWDGACVDTSCAPGFHWDNSCRCDNDAACQLNPFSPAKCLNGACVCDPTNPDTMICVGHACIDGSGTCAQ